MLTIDQYARKHFVHPKTVYYWIKKGKIPCEKVKLENPRRVSWMIPKDAQPPRVNRKMQQGGRSASRNRRISKSAVQLQFQTERELDLYICKCSGAKTYGQMSRETGIPTTKLRAMYDRLHALYGI